MQTKRTNTSETEVSLTISANEGYLRPIKEKTLERLGGKVRISGFREGKAPLHLIEKNIDQQLLQSEFIQDAIDKLYVDAVKNENLRPVSRPQVDLKKFVPFSSIEFQASFEVIGNITLADYKKIKKVKPEIKVDDKDIEDVIKSLKTRMAEKKDVDRAAKEGDQVWIDFSGQDTKKQPIKGAEGKDYPLILGSKTFIPGFEENLVGLQANEEKSFPLTFPDDYGVGSLAGQKVTFTVTVTKVQEVIEPAVDDEFAKKAGPFKDINELKIDIKKQLENERNNQAQREFEDGIIKEITQKSTVAVPVSMVKEQSERMIAELKQSILYRGQTWQEFLDSEKKNEQEYIESEVSPAASERVKAGLILSEISEREKLDVTPEELETRITLLKGQYQDDAMQSELDKPDNRRDIAARILTEKTVQKLVDYASQK